MAEDQQRTYPPKAADRPGCNVCGAVERRLLFRRDGYDFVRCQNCRMVYIAPMPASDQLGELYSEAYFRQSADRPQGISYCDYESEAEVLRPNFHARLDEIERIAPRGRILDVGCAYGFFLKAAQERGWEAWGVELSEHAAAHAQDKLGLKVIQDDLLGADLPLASFDAITLWDTIEHLIDPVAVLRRAYDLLHPAGVVAVGTDDIGAPVARLLGRHWYAIAPPWHTHHFSRPALREALECSGFEVLKIKRRGKFFELRTIAARLKTFYNNRLTAAFHRWLAASRPGMWRIYINRGDWIVAYGRKPIS